MSLISVLKTIQSFYYLGKRINRKLTTINCRDTEEPFTIVYEYSWKKAFDMILEHSILSLKAFKHQVVNKPNLLNPMHRHFK